MKRLFGRRREDPAHYLALAEGQGVRRPFRILVAMPQEPRSHLAALLGIRLRPETQSPESQAWRIINSDLRGIQARSHGPREQFVPLARNHNWWEIVMKAGRRLKLSVYPGLSEREVERLLFEEIARRVIHRLPEGEVEELDRVAFQEPSLTAALSSLGLSRDGRRLVLAGLGRVSATCRTTARRGLSKSILQYLSHGMDRIGCLHSLSRALRFTKDSFGNLVMAWTSMEAFRRSLGRTTSRFVGVLMALYFHNLLEEGLEEAELLKA